MADADVSAGLVLPDAAVSLSPKLLFVQTLPLGIIAAARARGRFVIHCAAFLESK